MVLHGISGNNIKIIPTVSSWRSLDIATMESKCTGLAQNSSTYGLTGMTSHMLGNNDWGACAYFTQSKYGRNGTRVTINNNSNYITGIAGNSIGDTTSTASTANSYDTPAGGLASTTGNIYGIYDMVGCAWEYMQDVNHNIDQSIYGTNSNRKGNAIYETSYADNGLNSWNNEYAYYATSGWPYIVRGGLYYAGAPAGIFSFSSGDGTPSVSYGFRPVIIPNP